MHPMIACVCAVHVFVCVHICLHRYRYGPGCVMGPSLCIGWGNSWIQPTGDSLMDSAGLCGELLPEGLSPRTGAGRGGSQSAKWVPGIGTER